MIILGIETSCDETAAAVVADGKTVLSSIVSSQHEVHHPYGGVVPELASRKHIEAIVPVVDEAISASGIDADLLDAVAVTRGPGLVGALLAAEDSLLPRDTVVVSVETSLALPGAAQGEGPVIRTGDRATTFDNSAEAYLVAARANLLAEDGDFKCQRQLMGAGGCEASAFAAHGYSVTGMAYPLGAWHNAGPDSTITAEYISLDDFAGGVLLATEAAKLAGTDPAGPATRRLRQPVDGAERQRLRNG